jgi:hypothetical protein
MESQRQILNIIHNLFQYASLHFYILVSLLKLHKLRDHKQSKAKDVKPIIHPDELNLRRISSDEEVINRCGMQLFEIYNEEDPEKMVSGYDYQKFHLLIV